MIIGIGGVSTAGKTTTANRIRKLFDGLRVSIICQDDFVKPVNEIPVIGERVDWEHPDSVDHSKLFNTILAEKQVNDIVIAEGLMIFYHKEIDVLFDKRIFITIDFNTFKQRKAIDNRWGHEPEWYINHIWDSYLKFGQVTNPNDTLILDGTLKIPDAALKTYLKR
jgi:uridine kinase